MQTKAFELRDKGTFIPVVAIQMSRGQVGDGKKYTAENWLMRKAGYNLDDPPLAVLLCRMDADGSARQASADPYGWGVNRTYTPAHLYIQEHWGELKSGDVVDVEFLLGETTTQKASERESIYP